MKRHTSNLALAVIATFFAGTVMAQVDTTSTPTDTTAAPADTTVSVPDTTESSPNAKVDIRKTNLGTAVVMQFYNHSYITNRELLNREQAIKTEETEA